MSKFKYRWASQDADGSIYLYEHKPRVFGRFYGWTTTGGSYSQITGMVIPDDQDGIRVPDWMDRLVDLTSHVWCVDDEGRLIGIERRREHDNEQAG